MCIYRVFTTVLKALGTNFSPSRSNVSPADVKKVRAIFLKFHVFYFFFNFVLLNLLLLSVGCLSYY